MDWSTIWAFLVAHRLEIWFVFSVLMEQLPPPTATSSGVYKYFYSVLQVFAANWSRAKNAVITPKQS
jgi:hypothetical protein